MFRRPSRKDRSPAPPDPEEVRAQLERVLASPQFRSSRRSANLLQFTVERALAGEPDQLKERVIGAEIYGRPADYDTNADPIVRSSAGEVRKRLAQYYLEPEREFELRIEIPSGSYVPQFSTAPAPASAPRPWRRLALAAAAGLLAAGALTWWGFSSRRPGTLDRFWAPVLEAKGQILVVVGQPTTYNFAGETMNKIDHALDSAAGSQEHRVPSGDLIRYRDRYITLYDAMCLSRVTGLLTLKGKSWRIRGGNATSLSDLRDHGATVLVGALDNQWTMRLTGLGRLRFSFESSQEAGYEMVRDWRRPERTDWRIPLSWPQWNVSRDYAIVSRLIDPTTDRAVVSAAGLTHFGTNAAGEFVASAAYLEEALRAAPPDWDRKSMQVVLETKVVDGEPGPPRVLAVHFW